MADIEDVKLDGRPLQSLRVADLKAALEERGLPKSGQKNTLVKRLKGALMLENLQRTSHHHIGLQPNSQIGEEMSQNSFIKQYLAKQQELLRQRLEREAREAVEDDDTDKEDHTKDNNSSACAAPDQDVLVDQHKLFGLSEGKGLAGPASEGEGHMSRDGHVSAPPAPTSAAVASLAVRVGEQRPERVPTSSQVPADSDDDGADEDWDSGARRRNLGEPPRGQLARVRSGGSRQHPQHIPPLLSPQLRQPTPPPSPPPELSFPLPDTPKQSPPSPGEPPARQRTSSTSSSGSSSSGSCSSSPDPQSNTERKPGPLTLLARKMASEGAFSGVGWHGRGDAERQDNNAATATMSSGRGPQDGTVSAITHTTNAAASLPFPRLVPVTNQGVLGGHLPHSEVPVSVLRPTIMEERDAAWQQENKEKELQAEREREKSPEQERLGAMEQERLERQRIFEQQRAVEQERERALERERKEREKALARERKEREMALEREKALEQERKERALARERAQALEREEEEREKALAKEREEREKAMQLEKQRAMERERALEQEREREEKAALEREREEKAALEREREEKAALEREREEKAALEREEKAALEREEKAALEREEKAALEREEKAALEREEKAALEREEKAALEREEKAALEREEKAALEREEKAALEREEKAALEREEKAALERERMVKVLELERQKALEREMREKEREEKVRALEQERIEREKALEKERTMEKEREERERALEQEKVLQREKEKALEQEMREKEREEKVRALEQERIEREKALEKERTMEKEREERERALEQEKVLQREKEKALQREKEEKERALEQENVLQREKEERERALEQEKALQREKEEKERALEQEKALQREKEEKERALEQEKALQIEKEERERAFEQEKALQREKEERERALEQEKALQREKEEKERALEQEKALQREKEEKERALEQEKALQREKEERERALEQEKALQREKERALEQEKALQREKEERERALEQEKALQREKEEREKALEQEKALQREKEEKERALEQEKALQREKEERERALEQEKALQREKEERERALEQEKALQREKERALEKEKVLQREKEERERALEQEKALHRERERALEQEKASQRERERALEQEKASQRERERALEQEKASQRERERALEQEKASQREKEKRESHLPPWKRSREFGLTPLPTPPLSTGAGKMAATEEGGEPKVPSLPQKALRDNQPAESGTPLSQSLAMSLSPQSSFKKFRFLRDPIVLSQSSASGIIKRPRTFSERHHPQSLALQSPSKFGEPEQEGTQQGSQPSAGQAAPKKPARQGVLVSGADTSGTTGPERETRVISTLGKSPEEEKGQSLVSEEHVQAHREETDKQVVGETAREAKAPSGPAGAVLPPSPQPVEGKVEKGRERSQKKEEKLGRRSSSSNDSSDSGSSSSGSSGSSSSQGKTHTTPSGRRPEKPQTNTISQDTETVSQPEDPTEAPKAPQHKKRVSGEEKEDINIVGARHWKKPFLGIHAGEDNGQKDSEGEEVKTDTTREVNEAAMAEPKKAPESSEECETPKTFTARRISLSSSKASPGAVSAEGETESGAGRKRRWGSSTAVTAKKSSMSITTDSLKSLIPDIRLCPGQEMVVDLHPEEDHLSGVEEEGRERGEQDLKIRRTVTQVVPSVTQENGQKESKRSQHEEEDREDGGEVKGDREEKMDGSFQRDSLETQCPSPTSHDMEMKTVTPSDTLIRRSISQQKSGVSITIDDPVRTAKQPSPPRGKLSNIVHVSNLVRPFTLGQLKELLGRTGTVLEDGFWIDKIKSHCYVTYSSAEESIATRAALHGVKWPQSNPKFLSLDFIQQEELDFQRGLPPPERAGEAERGAAAVPGRGAALPPLLPEREQWAEREREMEHRERTRAEREWDRDKVRDLGPGKPGEEAVPRRSRSRERKRKERKMDKKEKAADELPVKLLDELFNKTKAAPCIYWLPLTEEQFAQKETARQERMKRRKEQQEEVEKKREEERKERMKAASVASGERGEGERYREREGDWGRDGESGKHREDCYRRPGGSSAGGARRSRSRSDPPPRDRRR
ncbi:apoptotic chromatin condensation inducer in the nucleus-like [Salvelinus fontinalis]|uniref:apoptotic chromatin condensation inducer in the nucleus-like n=1 Tax=Salvelinus fontinalis TaxID=8038 RepID=UPI0024855BDA|nr:apoptotic chromatin condensation inducer in the nucleus-like [Salvelinus fontinalis]